MSLLAAARGFVAAYAARPALVADQRGWHCAIALVAEDTQAAVHVRIADGHVTAVEDGPCAADVVVRAANAVLLDVLELRRSPNEPYLFGELTVQGPEAHFLRLDYIATTLGPL